MPRLLLRPLNRYYESLKKYKIHVDCPSCNVKVLPKEYERHSSTCMNLNSATHCVWCQGNVCWEPRMKNQHVDHLIRCSETFIASAPLLISSVMTCMAFQLCGHRKFDDLPPEAYHLDWLLPHSLIPFPNLTFQYDSLNVAIGYILKYLMEPDLEWFHIMVKPAAFPTFVQAMHADRGNTFMLPFSCWCNGGQEEDARHRMHRHMICFSKPNGHFKKKIWDKVCMPPEDRPRANFPCKRLKSIQSVGHLGNAMGYLSKPESRCNFSFDPKKEHPENLNHLYIFTPLPTCYKLIFSLFWNGGIMELINQEFKNISIQQLSQIPVTLVQRQWHVAIKDLPGIPLHFILPVSRHFKPCIHPTEYFVYLNHGRKMFFEKDENLLSLDTREWNLRQADMKNLFYAAVGEDLWKLKPHQQKWIHVLQPLQEENSQLKAEMVKINNK